MGRLITAPGVLKNVQGQIDHVTQLYDEIKDNNLRGITIDIDDVSNANGAYDHTTTGLTQVTENMKAIAIEVDTPEVFCDQISITPGNGTVRLQCSEAHGTSKVKVTFVHTRPVDGGETAPDGVTSTEFDVLAGRIGSLSALDTSAQTSLVAAVNELVADDQDIREAMAIVANGNTHVAIGTDKYVFVKNHSTLDTGLYHNKSGATIGLNAELSLTNLEPDPEGMANALNSKIATQKVTGTTLAELTTAINALSDDEYLFSCIRFNSTDDAKYYVFIPMRSDIRMYSVAPLGGSSSYIYDMYNFYNGDLTRVRKQNDGTISTYAQTIISWTLYYKK